MIRRGKTEGWLQLPPEARLAWTTLNDVHFNLTQPGVVEGRGGALLASQDLDANNDAHRLLLTVPRDLILSLEQVREHAKVDRDFREVLESLGDLGRTPRGAILSFLILQASISSPHLPYHVGVRSAFSDYIKSLPTERLPTTWNPEELQLLVGTTLGQATGAKVKSLHLEYELLCSSTQHTRWYQAVQDHLEFDDWLQADAMYRSRALDFPNIGHCMVPCIDLANHAAGDATVALYEKTTYGDAILLLIDGKTVSRGDEVTITYGDEKGASEMLFSYGFLDSGMDSAQTMLLSLTIPPEDKYRVVKARLADCAPGFNISETPEGDVRWEGDYVWLLCVTEEDDLQFAVARTVDGEEDEVQPFFQGEELTGGAAGLRTRLSQTALWDVYQLRAISILQERVFSQMQILYSTEEEVADSANGAGSAIPTATFEAAMKLRELEFSLLNKAYETFEHEKLELAQSSVVIRYLAKMREEDLDHVPDDFS